MRVAILGLVIGPMLWSPLLAPSLSSRSGASFLAQAVAADAPPTADDSTGAALSVEVAGQCPRREAVVAALVPVVGKNAIGPGQQPPRVSDLGDRFQVSAAGQTGQYVDAARDCVERARVAAVFIALALNPPLLRSDEAVAGDSRDPDISERAPTESSTRPSGATASARWTQLAVAARIDAPAAEGGMPANIAAGGEIRAALGKGPFGFVLGAGLLMPTTTTFGSVPVRQQRFPCGLAVMARRSVSPSVEIGADLGASLAIVTLRGQSLDTVTPATRLDTGVRLSIQIRVRDLVRWMVPFAGVHAEFFPRPYLLEVDPLGEIGKTNRLWLGGSAGISFESP